MIERLEREKYDSTEIVKKVMDFLRLDIKLSLKRLKFALKKVCEKSFSGRAKKLRHSEK